MTQSIIWHTVRCLELGSFCSKIHHVGGGRVPTLHYTYLLRCTHIAIEQRLLPSLFWFAAGCAVTASYVLTEKSV